VLSGSDFKAVCLREWSIKKVQNVEP